MRPKKSPQRDQQRDLFRSELSRIINSNHGIVKLAKVVEWDRLDELFGAMVMSGYWETEFVTALLSQANEQLERSYELKGLGYDLKKIGERVSKIYGIAEEEIYSIGRCKPQVTARDLLCYWAVRELGMSCTDVAKRLGMSQPGVGCAVSRKERIAKKQKYQLLV